MIRFVCPHCQAPLKAPDELAGGQVQCQGCGLAIHVPDHVPPVRRPGLAEDQPEDEPPHPVGEPNGVIPFQYQPAMPYSSEGSEPSPAYSTEEPAYEPAGVTTYEPPVRSKPLNVFSPFFGVIGAALLGVGAFFDLVYVNPPQVTVEGRTFQVEFQPYWILPVRIGSVALGVAALLVALSRQYAGFWILGVGTLVSMGIVYLMFFHLKLRDIAKSTVKQQFLGMMDSINEDAVITAVTKCFYPGPAFGLMAGGAVSMIIAAMIARRYRRREIMYY